MMTIPMTGDVPTGVIAAAAKSQTPPAAKVASKKKPAKTAAELLYPNANAQPTGAAP